MNQFTDCIHHPRVEAGPRIRTDFNRPKLPLGIVSLLFRRRGEFCCGFDFRSIA